LRPARPRRAGERTRRRPPAGHFADSLASARAPGPPPTRSGASPKPGLLASAAGASKPGPPPAMFCNWAAPQEGMHRRTAAGGGGNPQPLPKKNRRLGTNLNFAGHRFTTRRPRRPHGGPTGPERDSLAVTFVKNPGRTPTGRGARRDKLSLAGFSYASSLDNRDEASRDRATRPTVVQRSHLPATAGLARTFQSSLDRAATRGGLDKGVVRRRPCRLALHPLRPRSHGRAGRTFDMPLCRWNRQ